MRRPNDPTLSDVVREFLCARARAAGRGGQTELAAKMGVARQQINASLQGDRVIMLKHLDALLEAEALSTEELLLELARVARRLRRAKRSAAA